MRRAKRWITLAATACVAAACGGDPEGTTAAALTAAEDDAPGAAPPSAPGETDERPEADVDDAPAGETQDEPSAQRRIAAKLGLPPSFAIGLGHDALDLRDANQMQAYALPAKVDIHYMYLSGLDWPAWQPNGGYVTAHAEAAKARGIVPMFTLYQAAASGDGNLAAMNGDAFMREYWAGVRLAFERLGEVDTPAIVHLEPDLWGYAQKQGGDDPSAVKMRVAALVPECADLPDDVSGAAKCMIRLARSLAPKAVVGLSASSFGAPDPASVGAYLVKLGAADADIVVVETLDRDAGCFEAAVDPNCRRSGDFYWDETNATHPSFHDHLAWARTIHEITGKPLLWWQMPLGQPSASPGGSAGRYRDNRVRYLFAHPEEFAAAGGIGAVFGSGKENQTTAATDGGQFASALVTYRSRTVPLP